MLSKQQTPSEADWDEKVAAGSQKLPVAVSPRTTTLDDPLTTRILAEVARRSSTIEISPEEIDEAIRASDAADAPPGDETAAPADDPA